MVDGFRLVRDGLADVAYAGGSESGLMPEGDDPLTAGLRNLRVHTEEDVARPFDLDRQGFVYAEGAGVLRLETLDAARARGARIYAEVLGGANTVDANDLIHPSGDLVVAALVIAARMEASDLSSLLSRLADATRGEARMRIRVDVGRTRVRTATKVIVGVVVAAVVFLALVNRDYLAVYDSPVGQLVLAVVGAIFATGGWLLTRMARIDLPERFTARAASPTAVGAEP